MPLDPRLTPARPDLAKLAGLSVVLVGLQSLSGAFLPWTNLSFASTMAHAAIMAVLFVVAAESCRVVLPQPAPKAMPQPDHPAPSAGAHPAQAAD